MRVLFRVDAGRRWGLSFGHAFRCLALAEELRGRGDADIRFLMTDIAEGVAVVRDRGWPVVLLPDGIAGADQVEALAAADWDVVVCDLPRPAELPLQRLAPRPVVVLADGGLYRNPAVLVVDAAAGLAETETPLLKLGPAYCILGPQFDGCRRSATNPGSASLALATFGGSDPAGLTLKTTRALATRLPAGLTLHVVLGPGFAGRDEVEAAAGRTTQVVQGIPDMATAMREADFVIAAAGRTAYELAATGTPAILIPSIAHEELTAAGFAAAGSAVDLGPWNDESASRLAQSVTALAADPSRREAMRQAGLATVDGGGRRRIADLIRG